MSNPPTLQVWITDAGLAALAKGQQLNHSHFSVSDLKLDMELHYKWLRVGQFTPTLPNKALASETAIAALYEQEQKVRAQAENALTRIQAEINSILAIEGPKNG